jgi:hypothetical protein
MNALSTAAAALYDIINAATSPDQMDNLGRALWHLYSKGDLADDEAQFLSGAIEKRRPNRRSLPIKPIGTLNSRISRFVPRQRPRSPDRKASRERRRTLGSSSSMPPALRALFPEGQRSVLAIVAGEVKHHGTCDLPYDKIAALAGVCRTTVQNAMHEARRLGLINVLERPLPGRKNLTNVIRLVSHEWLVWLKRGPTAHRPTAHGPAPTSHPVDAGANGLAPPSSDAGQIGSNSMKMVSTTKSTDLRKEEVVRDSERRTASPPTGNPHVVDAANRGNAS